jgi:hypothetical protein
VRRILLAAAVTAAVIAWSLTGIGGAPAECLPACDCQPLSTGAIRQPAAAWSALVIVAAGAWVLLQRGRLAAPAGWGIVAAGLAAFLAHTSVTAWAYDLDGAAVVLAAWLFAAGAVRPAFAPVAAVPAAAAFWSGPPASAWLAAAGAAVFLAASRSKSRLLLPSAVVLGAGLVARALGDDGGALCRGEFGWTGHVVWHLAAAAGLALAACRAGACGNGEPGRPALASGEREEAR